MRFLQTLLVASLTVFCLSCSRSSSRKQNASELHFVFSSEPVTFDPRLGGRTTSQLITYQLFEGLTRADASGKPQLAIAEAIDISDDGTVYTFHMRPSKWSNGDELTAMDFEYAWKCAISPEFGSQFAFAFYVIRNAKKALRNECPIDDVGIQCLDAHTLQVTLEHPAPYFLDWTSNPLYSPVYRPVAQTNPQWARDVFPTFISNGPYSIVEHLQGSHTVLKKNPLYWNAKDGAKTETLRFSIIEDPLTAYNVFLAGDADWFGAPFSPCTPPEILKNLEKQHLLRSLPTALTRRLDCCVSKPHLASVKIRKAFACAINRKELASLFFVGENEPAASIVTKTISLLPSPQFEDGNVEMARRLFAEGCAELGLTAYPPLSILTRSDSKDLAVILAERLHTILDIKASVEVCDPMIFRKRIACLDGDIALHDWITMIPDPTYDLSEFRFKTTLTPTDWESPEFQRLFAAAEATHDEEKRTELLRRAETLLIQELPAIPLIYESFKYAKNPDITGDHFLPIGLPELKRFELYESPKSGTV